MEEKFRSTRISVFNGGEGGLEANWETSRRRRKGHGCSAIRDRIGRLGKKKGERRRKKNPRDAEVGKRRGVLGRPVITHAGEKRKGGTPKIFAGWGEEVSGRKGQFVTGITETGGSGGC